MLAGQFKDRTRVGGTHESVRSDPFPSPGRLRALEVVFLTMRVSPIRWGETRPSSNWPYWRGSQAIHNIGGTLRADSASARRTQRAGNGPPRRAARRMEAELIPVPDKLPKKAPGAPRADSAEIRRRVWDRALKAASSSRPPRPAADGAGRSVHEAVRALEPFEDQGGYPPNRPKPAHARAGPANGTAGLSVGPQPAGRSRTMANPRQTSRRVATLAATVLANPRPPRRTGIAGSRLVTGSQPAPQGALNQRARPGSPASEPGRVGHPRAPSPSPRSCRFSRIPRASPLMSS